MCCRCGAICTIASKSRRQYKRRTPRLGPCTWNSDESEMHTLIPLRRGKPYAYKLSQGHKSCILISICALISFSFSDMFMSILNPQIYHQIYAYLFFHCDVEIFLHMFICLALIYTDAAYITGNRCFSCQQICS
jgi:hypothetical protein